MDIAAQYRRFAAMEARGQSETYFMVAGEIAADAAVLALIDQLPASKRQPNLLLGTVRFLGGPVEEYPGFPRMDLGRVGSGAADHARSTHPDERAGPMRHPAAAPRRSRSP